MPRSVAKANKKNKRARNMRASWKRRCEDQNLDKSNYHSQSNVVNDADAVSSISESSSRILDNSNVSNASDVETNTYSDLECGADTCISRIPNCNKRVYGGKTKKETTISGFIQSKSSDTLTAMDVMGMQFGLDEDEMQRINEHELEVEAEPPLTSAIVGNRIVELGYVLDCVINLQFKHSQMCSSGKLNVQNEFRRGKGLLSTVQFQCNVCGKTYQCITENPNRPKSLINVGAVWGTLASGSTFEHMAEFLSCMDIPTMNRNMFYDMESELGKNWDTSLVKSMNAAAAKEKDLAVKKKQVCPDGTPWITVYVDGSWSKRSYGTNYNALSGMAAIIGKQTGEVLFIGIRNKFCSICTRAATNNVVPKKHLCFKNWKGSAPAMESDIIVEGFNCSESLYGLRYLKFIGDGDSSVFSSIQDKVDYGRNVKKVECSNHALKNYGKRLRKTKADTNISFKGRKLLTGKKINELTKRAKCSIYEHSKKENRDVDQLRTDLRNGLHHVFGDHSSCRDGICNTPGQQELSCVEELKSTSIYNHLRGDLDLLVRKAHLLIENENNNRAENLMNIVSRFCDGKRLNLIQRGSYQRRVCLSALRYNKRISWHHSPYKNVTGSSPGSHFKAFMKERMDADASRCRKRLIKKNHPDARHPKKKIKLESLHTEPNTYYGPNVEEVEDDDMMQNEVENIIARLRVSKEERDAIQNTTVGQFGNEVFRQERQHRLTASLFGKVVKRRLHTPCHTLVKACLSSRQFWSEATEYGIVKEKVAIALFEKKTNLKVRDSGIWIDLQHGFLGASPDGIVEHDNAVIEVKCLFSASKLQLQSYTIEEVVTKLKGKICLEINENGLVQLNRKHQYYWQIQGQLNITQKNKCYFVVYVSDKVDLFVEEIVRDEDFWNATLPVLIRFYRECIGPEIVRNRIDRGLKCKDPLYIREAIAEFQKKKEAKLEQK